VGDDGPLPFRVNQYRRVRIAFGLAGTGAGRAEVGDDLRIAVQNPDDKGAKAWPPCEIVALASDVACRQRWLSEQST